MTEGAPGPTWPSAESRLDSIITLMSAPDWDASPAPVVAPETVAKSRAIMVALRKRGVAAPYLYPIGGSAGISFEWAPGGGWEVDMEVEPDRISADATNTSTCDGSDFELPPDADTAEIVDRLAAMLERARRGNRTPPDQVG